MTIPPYFLHYTTGRQNGKKKEAAPGSHVIGTGEMDCPAAISLREIQKCTIFGGRGNAPPLQQRRGKEGESPLCFLPRFLLHFMGRACIIGALYSKECFL